MEKIKNIAIVIILISISWDLAFHNQLYGQTSLVNLENKVRRDKRTGIPAAIYNVKSKQYSGTPVQIARQYLNENYSLLRMDKNLEGLQLIEVKKSPAGKHVSFGQVYRGIPVMRSETVVSINHHNRVGMVINHYKPDIEVNITPSIIKEQAIRIARQAVAADEVVDLFSPITQLMVYEDSVSVFHLVWEVRIFPSDRNTSCLIIVDSHNGEIFETINMTSNFVNGTGRVFDPDPGTALRDSTLPDNNDADYPEIQPAYDTITLRDLNDAVDDTFRVRGRYAWSQDIRDPYDSIAKETDPDDFTYNRSQNGFEEVNIYYFVDKLRRYIGDLDPEFNPEWVFNRGQPDSIRSEAIRFDARGYPFQQASYDPGPEYMYFGVPDDTTDTGEDQSLILHEYGHALHDALISGYGMDGANTKGDTYGIGEGLADYLQISYRRTTQPSNPYRPNHRSNWAIPNPVTYAKSILPPDSAKYPDPDNGGHWSISYYDKMQVWASTLMDMEYNIATDPSQGERLGRDVTTKLMLTSLSYVTSSSTVQDNVYAILQADRDISEYSGQHLSELADVFINRGFFYYEEVYDPITSDETWSGYLVLTDDITVSNNVTLTISPGTFVFGDDHQITVNGTLDINGTADSSVTISETYICASSGSTVEMDYTDISDSYSHGLYVSSGTAKINNCTFSNNDDIGIYLDYPQSGSEIENCTFTGNSDGGVKIYSGSPLDIKNCTFTGNGVFGLYLGSVNIPNDRIADNWLEDNYDGIYFASGGNANLTTTRPDPWDHQNNPGEAYLNNIIKDNDRYGAWVSYSSTPVLGSLTYIIGEYGGEYYYYGGFNAFVDAGAFKYIRNYGNSYIDIRLNFWDVDAEDVSDYLIGNFTESEGSNLYINPGSLSKSAGAGIAGTTTDNDHQLSPLKVQLLEGDSLLITMHLDQAFEVYDRIVNNSPDADEARVALNRIIYIYWNQGRQDNLISYLDGIHSKFSGKLIGIIAYDYTTPLFVMKGDVDNAINVNDEVVDIYKRLNEPEYLVEALYENMMIYDNIAMEASGSEGLSKTSASAAVTKYNEYKDLILNDYPETSVAELLREEYHLEPPPEPITTVVPTEYALHACYPNPFNPLTNIVFDLPEESRVSLVVYNLAGHRVWEMPNNGRVMSPGQYTFQWDGKNMDNGQVASGIYLIRLITPEYNQTRKAVFMK